MNRVALDRLLQHTRRGSLQALWETALAEADARLARCEDTSAGDSPGSATPGSPFLLPAEDHSFKVMLPHS